MGGSDTEGRLTSYLLVSSSLIFDGLLCLGTDSNDMVIDESTQKTWEPSTENCEGGFHKK